MKFRFQGHEVVIHKFWATFLRVGFLFYIGGVFIHISFVSNVNTIGQLPLFISGLVGGAFMTYGVTIFILDVRESESLKELWKTILSNFKRAYKK